ncbi:tetratricopeptide repeat protein [Natronospora cellulosivora (SeqCode)]
MNYKIQNIIFFVITLIICSFLYPLMFNNIVYSQNVNIIDWNELKRESQEIIKEDDNNILANFNYSISMANLGEIEDAYDYFEIIKNRFTIDEFNNTINPLILDVDHNSNNILLLNYAAFTSAINSNYEYSIPYFKRILIIEPNNIWVKNFLAATYLELKDYDLAIETAMDANRIKRNQYSHLIIGVAHYNNGNTFRALNQFRRAGNLIARIIFND